MVFTSGLEWFYGRENCFSCSVRSAVSLSLAEHPLVCHPAVCRRSRREISSEKIILFGSYAYGQPHDESDVDLLVIMQTRDVVNAAIRISAAFDWPFSLDLIVRTPRQIASGRRNDDWFLREVTEKGKVLYKAQTAQWVLKAEEDWDGANELAGRTPPLRDLACFHCQQAAEKYLKAAVQKLGVAVPRTHNLNDLLNLLLPQAAALASLRRRLIASHGTRSSIVILA